MTSKDGWTQHSKLVISSIEQLQASLGRVENRLQTLETEIVKLHGKEGPAIQRIHTLEKWKTKIDDVVSAPQLAAHIEEIDNLKTFKTRATFIFSVVQGVILIGAFLMKFLPGGK
tara:strand:+ start:175 stop:519 length:345 start_codon:yes stop_codon:yes gene_type:complete